MNDTVSEQDNGFLLPYSFSACRNVTIWQDEGVISYDAVFNPSRMQVGQFIARHPLTDEFNEFSIREYFSSNCSRRGIMGCGCLAGVLCIGKSGTISVGLVPQNYAVDLQPGWKSGSVGYHGDDGGIYYNQNWTNVKQAIWSSPELKRNDEQDNVTITVRADVANRKITFLKNGEEQYTISVSDRSCSPLFGFALY